MVTPLEPKGGLFDIRDSKGYPVPCSAMLTGADVLVTGDQDFDAAKVDSPEILTPAEHVERHVNTT